MQANITTIESLDDPSGDLAKFREIAQRLIGDARVNPFDGVAWVLTHNSYFNIRPLLAYGLTTMDIPLIAEKSMQASSTKGNPVKLTEVQISSILEEALG
jgi:alcohol dehydrogenase class IV